MPYARGIFLDMITSHDLNVSPKGCCCILYSLYGAVKDKAFRRSLVIMQSTALFLDSRYPLLEILMSGAHISHDHTVGNAHRRHIFAIPIDGFNDIFLMVQLYVLKQIAI